MVKMTFGDFLSLTTPTGSFPSNKSVHDYICLYCLLYKKENKSPQCELITSKMLICLCQFLKRQLQEEAGAVPGTDKTSGKYGGICSRCQATAIGDGHQASGDQTLAQELNLFFLTDLNCP